MDILEAYERYKEARAKYACSLENYGPAEYNT